MPLAWWAACCASPAPWPSCCTRRRSGPSTPCSKCGAWPCSHVSAAAAAAAPAPAPAPACSVPCAARSRACILPKSLHRCHAHIPPPPCRLPAVRGRRAGCGAVPHLPGQPGGADQQHPGLRRNLLHRGIPVGCAAEAGAAVAAPAGAGSRSAVVQAYQPSLAPAHSLAARASPHVAPFPPAPSPLPPASLCRSDELQGAGHRAEADL